MSRAETTDALTTSTPAKGAPRSSGTGPANAPRRGHRPAAEVAPMPVGAFRPCAGSRTPASRSAGHPNTQPAPAPSRRCWYGHGEPSSPHARHPAPSAARPADRQRPAVPRPGACPMPGPGRRVRRPTDITEGVGHEDAASLRLRPPRPDCFAVVTSEGWGRWRCRRLLASGRRRVVGGGCHQHDQPASAQRIGVLRGDC